MAEFYTVITDAGREAVARAMQAGEKVDITHFAVGDGGGVPVTPNESQTQLVNECWRGLVSTYKQEGTNIIIDTYIPSDEESFTAREMGVFTADGVLFAVCNTPEMRKVLPNEGAVGNFTLAMQIDVSNLDTNYIVIQTNPQLDFIKNSEKGQPNGVLPLNEEGKADAEYLPEMDFYTKAETLADDTKTLFGLDVSALPDAVFNKIKTLIDSANNNANSKTAIVRGSYTGDGSENKFIGLSFTPSCVLLAHNGSDFSEGYCGLATMGYPAFVIPSVVDKPNVVEIVSNGFRVKLDSSRDCFTNSTAQIYNYVIFK